MPRSLITYRSARLEAAPRAAPVANGCQRLELEAKDPPVLHEDSAPRAVDPLDVEVGREAAQLAQRVCQEPQENLLEPFGRGSLFAHGLETIRGKRRVKGDRWRAPDREAWCWYAESWAAVKERWELEVSAAEGVALAEMWATCP